MAFLLVTVAAALGVLLLGVAGDRKDMRALPDAVGSSVEVLADRRTETTFADVLGKPQTDWETWDGRGYIRSYAGEVVWVRVTLRNPTDQPLRGVLADAEYYTDRIDLWVQTQGEGGAAAEWRSAVSGELTPPAEKALWGRDSAFFVDVPAGGQRVTVLRLDDHFGGWLRPVWWPDERRFLAAQLRDTAAEAIYFGLLVALLVYNAVLWVRLRHRDIGYYLGYLCSVGCFMFFSRCIHQALGLAWGSPVMETFVTVALAASLAFVAQFARVFLDLARIAPGCDRVVRGLLVIGVVLAAGGLFFPWASSTIWMHFTIGGTALAHVVLFFVAIRAWMAGQKQGRFFVLSFGFLAVGVVPTAVIWLLAIPLGQSAMAMMTGSALEMLLLSLAVADRFAVMQQEKIAAQVRAVEEAEKRREIQEAYADELQHEVEERTRELAAANADKDRMMAVLGHDLRSPLTALTLSAEQVSGDAAATGARTAFAAEAAQTGRALLLLLEDVVLWARLRAGPGRAVEQAAHGVVAPAVELHRAAAARRGVELVLRCEPDLRVTTELVPAQTLVRNLTSNAVKNARSLVRVAASTDAAGRVRISVRDDGPGLPSGVLAYLQAHGREATAGPWLNGGGLGLRLCLEITRVLGTRLEVATPEGGGVEIWFTLPGAKDTGGPT
ncbi:MAG: sensor histidine kinase [Opitutaceae bacterium]|jgi:signal transduction histidine kinase|nr:sensor histidine kinase [Opitutaceae bacterium]